MEQIEMLRTSLSESEQQQKRLTLLITDQREKDQDTKTSLDTATIQLQKVEALEKTIQELKVQNRRIVQDLQSQKSQSFWKKLFG